MGIKKLVT